MTVLYHVAMAVVGVKGQGTFSITCHDQVKKRRNEDENSEPDRPSAIGTRLSDLITYKVIIIVALMLVSTQV